jgi:Fic family protein
MLTRTRVRRQDERVVAARLTIDLLRNFDEVYRSHSGVVAKNVGASLEDYVIATIVLIGEAEGRLFTAHKLATYLNLPRSTVQRKLDHLESDAAVERVDGGMYRLSPQCANETRHVDRAVKLITAASAALSKMGTKALGATRAPR